MVGSGDGCFPLVWVRGEDYEGGNFLYAEAGEILNYSPKSKVCPRLLPPRLFLKLTFLSLERDQLK